MNDTKHPLLLIALRTYAGPARFLAVLALLAALWAPLAAQGLQQNPWSVSLRALTHQYKGDFGNEILQFQSDSDFGFELGVRRALQERSGVQINYTNALVDYRLDRSRDYASRFPPNGPRRFETQLHYLRLGYDYRLLSKQTALVPYVLGGVGIAYTQQSAEYSEGGSDTNVLQLPLHAGLGLDIPLTASLTWSVEGVYHVFVGPARDNLEGRLSTNGVNGQFGQRASDQLFTLSTGLKIHPSKKRDTDSDGIADAEDLCPDVAGLPAFDGCPDTDGDGVQDSEDACPNQAGEAALGGCPDADSDGVADGEDACPNLAGLPAFNGCPDTDGDGVQDSEDACPNQAGEAALGGCPDTDKDGIADGEDACPNLAGLPEFAGCPDTDGDGIEDSKDQCPERFGLAALQGCDEWVYRLAVNGIDIPENDLAQLKDIAAALIERDKLSIIIEGHTDQTGEPTYNQQLSLARAQAAKEILVAQGMAPNRITIYGYGQSQLLRTENTAEAYAQNRRVVLRIINSDGAALR